MNWNHSTLQGWLMVFLHRKYEGQGFKIMPELRLRVSPTRVRVPDVCVFLSDPGERVPTRAPFICIEVLSPDDRLSRVQVRINDYLDMGVRYVWVLDPETRQADIATAAEGFREVKTGVLRT